METTTVTIRDSESGNATIVGMETVTGKVVMKVPSNFIANILSRVLFERFKTGEIPEGFEVLSHEIP